MDSRTDTYRAARWYNSLVFRVVLLCVVLVVCLFGSVWVVTLHYWSEAAAEVRSEVRAIAEGLQIRVEDRPDATIEDIKAAVVDLAPALEVDILPFDDDNFVVRGEEPQVTLAVDEEGRVVREALHYLTVGGRVLTLTARIPVEPQAELLRALRNRYMLALVLVFLLALGLLVYLIVRVLRPLSVLAETCMRVGSGELREIEVKHTASEVLALEHTFNDMVRSLREKEVVEANLRRAQRLSALGTLAAGVAHDVRNPLNAIKLLSSHALDAVGDTLAARHLTTIRNEVDHLEQIVSGFLSLARERELNPTVNRVDTLLEECIRLIERDAQARDLRVMTELRAGHTELMLDAKQWKRAVLNLLINAMEACPPGGRVRLFSRVTDTHCQIEVRDDGPGMTSTEAERAFDPYYTTKQTGTGLGLSITRAIVEEHGGTIELSSTPGQGCQVLVTVPLNPRFADSEST